MADDRHELLRMRCPSRTFTLAGTPAAALQLTIDILTHDGMRIIAHTDSTSAHLRSGTVAGSIALGFLGEVGAAGLIPGVARRMNAYDVRVHAAAGTEGTSTVRVEYSGRRDTFSASAHGSKPTYAAALHRAAAGLEQRGVLVAVGAWTDAARERET